MASLIKRNGYYTAQFYDSAREPKRKRLALGTRRKKVARQLLVKLEKDWRLGRFDPWTDDPHTYDKERYESKALGEAIKLFLSRKRREGRSEATLRTYREVVRLLIQAAGQKTPLGRLKPRKIEEVVWDGSIPRATQHKRYGHLRTFFRWCQKAREVLGDVERGKPRDFVFSPHLKKQERSARCFRNRVSRAFRKARRLAGIERKISFHGLKHGFCTLLAEAGKSAHVIKAAARHADISTSMRYVHLSNRHLKRKLEDVFD